MLERGMNTADATNRAIPCSRCGEPASDLLHQPASECIGCKAPHDHHDYRPDPDSVQAALVTADERSRAMDAAFYLMIQAGKAADLAFEFAIAGEHTPAQHWHRRAADLYAQASAAYGEAAK
jgi:hypothetical protein